MKNQVRKNSFSHIKRISQLTIMFNLLLSISLFCQDKQVNLQEYIKNFKNEIDAVSVSTAIIHKNKIVWKGSCGKADLKKDINFTTKHLFCLGSVSKLFTGSCLLKLYEEGKLSLDDDVNKFLSFSVRNPKYPHIPITVRKLLTHTSGIGDYQELQNRLYRETKGDSEMPLSEVAEKFFNPDGEFFRKDNFLDFKPGTKWKYSNWNFVLIGYIIEKISGEPFSDYCKKVLLSPLEMNSSGWFIKDVDINKISTMYRKNESGEKTKINPIYGWPGYCDGMLRSNVEEAANFVIMIINKGNFNGKQILKTETISEMLQPQNIKNIPAYFPFKDMGLVWFIPSGHANTYTHSGSPSGSVAMMMYNPDTKSGLVSYVTGINNRSSELISRMDIFSNYMLKHAETIK